MAMGIYLNILCIYTAFTLVNSNCINCPKTMKRVIIDADIGMDDAHALVMFLNADRQHIIKIEAIICSYGNTQLQNACTNLLRFMETAGRLDIPLLKGIKYPLTEEYKQPTWDGMDGFGDLNYTRNPSFQLFHKVSPTNALQMIINKNPGQITLITLATLTNIVLPMLAFNNFTNKIKDYYVMGGNYDYLNLGASYVPELEFNFYADPEATDIFVRNAKNRPLTMIPVEVCERFPKLSTFKWRWEVLGKINNPLCNFVKRADWAIYKNEDLNKVWIAYDAFLAFAFLYPDLVTIKPNISIAIELKDPKTRGLVIQTPYRGNVNVITAFNEERFKTALEDACKGVCLGGTCRDIYL